MKTRGVLIVLILSSLLFAQNDSVIISEIMFYPPSGNNEFIELYNLSHQNVNLQDFTIRYYTSLPDSITSAGYGTLLPPGCHAVIMEGDYVIENGIYKNIIPESALILKISNNAFGSNGMANTTSRPVSLYSKEGENINSYYYSADNAQTFSDEKMIFIADTSSSYWTNSLIQNGTPGFRNSVMLYNHNIKVFNLSCVPENPLAGDNIELNVNIKNTGTEDAGLFTVKIYNDFNFDSIPSLSEMIYSEIKSLLHSGDSVSVLYTINNLPAGQYNFIAEAEYPQDEFPSDNISCKNIRILQGTEPNSVIINEIMYAPQDGEPEWIEIYNNTPDNINLKNWGIGDAVSAYYITTDDLLLLSNSYIVLSKDSSVKSFYPFTYDFLEVYLPSLNNTGDAVVLFDSNFVTVDSLYYTPDWGGAGNKSIEKIEPSSSSLSSENWTTCVNMYRATPGFINSVTPKNNDISISSFRTYQEYGIVGEQVNFVLSVKNTGKNITGNFNISVYKDIDSDSIINSSEEIKIFTAGIIVPGDSLIFDFQFAEFNAGDNHFIARIFSNDEDTCNNIAFFSFKGVTVNFGRNDILINEIMHSPEDEPEWLEVYNNSSVNINLKNFLIADASDSVCLIKTDFILAPSAYLVITGDSILLQKRRIPSGVMLSSLPVLNNNGDKIILIDSLFRVIDSLDYHSFWGGQEGYSLERKNFNITSTDSLNWGTSVNRYKGTPGYINSLSPRNYDTAVEDILIYPEFPVKGDTVKIIVKLKNKGSMNTESIFKLYKDTSNDSIPDLLLVTSEIILNANDSLVYETGYSIMNIAFSENIYAEIFTQNDQDTSDNYLVKKISVGYKRNSVVINEVLYNPLNGEPEWIEIYNRSEDTISIKNWLIKDVSNAGALIKEDKIILPGEYKILTSDSSVCNFHRIIPGEIITCNLPNLNNDADGIVLLDERKIAIDSMIYKSAEDNNSSLERISSGASSLLINNWRNSVDIELSTPGRINSITDKKKDIAAGSLSIMPRFPCLNDTIIISASIRNLGRNICEGYSVQFSAGKTATSTADSVLFIINGNSVQSGDSVEIICPVSIYMSEPLKISLNLQYDGDEDTINNCIERRIYPGEKRGSIIINEVMYDPAEDDCEWVEIYNPTDQTQNLKNWSISDISPNPGKNFITGDEIKIIPGEYIVIAGDSSVARKFNSIKKLLIVKFGVLSSSGDGVIIYDYRDGIIDSMKYNPRWGGRKGRSLERKSIIKTAADSSNWTTSLSPLRATPGEINSVSGLAGNESKDVIINEIMYEPDIDNCEFLEFYNRSGEDINIGGWRIEGEGSDYFILSDTSFIIGKNNYLVFAADSIIYSKYNLSENSLVLTAGESSFGFGNNGETILLKDINGKIIDSLKYSSSFHNRNYVITRNRSLERINAEMESCEKSNWSSCTSLEGATPCKKNSIQTGFTGIESGLVISPNPFSPDYDGWEDFAIINYSLRTAAPQVRIKIYDNLGRLVRTLADNTPSGSKGQIIFDGRNDEGRALRIGIYILFLEAVGGGGVETYKSAFVIARKL